METTELIKKNLSKLGWHVIFTIGIILLLGKFSMVSGQSVESIDSLESIIANMPENRQKAESLTSLADKLMATNTEKALQVSQQLLELSVKLNYTEGIADAYYFQGKIYRDLVPLDSALGYSKKAVAYAELSRDKARLARSLSQKGHTSYLIYGADSAILDYQESYKLYEDLMDSVGMANSLNGIGVMYKGKGIYDSTVYYLHKAISIGMELGYEEVLGKAYINLAIAYNELREPDKAELYLYKSIPINEKLQNNRLLGLTYLNLGNQAWDRGNIQKALEYYLKALEIYEKENYLRGAALVTTNIGNVYDEWGMHDKAFDYYQKANEVYVRIGDMENFVINYKNIGLMHERWGDLKRAITIYDSCLAIANKFNFLYRQAEISLNLAIVHFNTGNSIEGYNYMWLNRTLEDSLFNIEKEKIIAELELEKKQTDIFRLENENLEQQIEIEKKTSQRNIFLFTGIGIIAFLLFLFLYFRQKAVKNRIIAEQRIKQLEEEKKVLQAKALVEGQDEERKRIAQELHDGLGVMLSTVKMQFTTLKDKSPENQPLIDRASKLLEQASGDIRKMSHNMMPGLLTKLGLCEAVQDLFESIRESENLDVAVEVPEGAKRLPENKEIMLYRIIQEMVNNSLKHADAKKISVRLSMLPGKIELFYSDDGKGFNVAEKLDLKTIGLKSIHSRVNFLNGKVAIDSREGKGTAYSIEVPLD